MKDGEGGFSSVSKFPSGALLKVTELEITSLHLAKDEYQVMTKLWNKFNSGTLDPSNNVFRFPRPYHYEVKYCIVDDTPGLVSLVHFFFFIRFLFFLTLHYIDDA